MGLFDFIGPASGLLFMDRVYKITEGVMRSLIIAHEE